MPTLHNSIAIDAAPDEVWRVLGDLAATPEWSPGIVSAEVTGDNRLCRTASFPAGARSQVEWEAEFDASDEVAAMVDGYYRQTLEALRRRVETGETAATM